MDLVNKNDVIKIAKDFTFTFAEERKRYMDFLEYCLDNAPTIEAKHVVHGEWVGNACSACGMNWDENMVNNADDWGYFEPMPNFCPNCGSDMRKKVEE